ncbi:MAG: type II toxin-antitoxin system HicB family antitoxin [Patescibacteria group bacterium]|nr:type II toxin-antitoxin system HicB family antitoxin [Patescibacteria group bacterium]
MKSSFFTIYIEQDEDGTFIGSIPSIPSCYAQGETQEEMLKNLRQVFRLCVRNTNFLESPKTKFIGIQNLKLSYA